MRRFSETLPTLRAANDSRGTPESLPDDRSAILKALGSGSGERSSPTRLGSQGARASATAPMRPFVADSLPRKSETRLGAHPFQKDLHTAIQSFQQPGQPKRDHEETTAKLEKVRSEEMQERQRAIEEARAEEREIAKKALVEARLRWAEESADKLSRDLDQEFVDLHNRLADAITLALTPVLEEAMRVKAVNRFSSALERMTGREGGSAAITVRGPQVLLDALKAARAGETAGLKLVAADESDLVACVNDTTLRTTIKAWATTLAAATGSLHA